MAKILAIDDKQDNLIAISALLKALMADSQVITAQSGIEGIERAKTERPDTILLDIKMPEMDGYEVCKRLKSDDRTKNIPVIMLTAINTDSKSCVRGLETGADAFLAKPVDECILIAQVKTALRIKEAEDRLRTQRDWLEEMVQQRTRALRESEEKYRSLIEHIPDVTWTADLSGKIVFISSNIEKVCGYTPEEISQAEKGLWFGEIDPDDIDTVKAAYHSLFARNRVFDVDYRIRKKDGSWIWLHNRAFATYAKNGVTYADGILSDITRRKQTESALKHSEQKLNSIMKNVPDIVYRLDPNGTITFISDAIKRYGYSADELRGTNILDLVHSEDRERVIYKINERRTGDRHTKSLEVRLLIKKEGGESSEHEPECYEDGPVFLITAEGLYESEIPETKKFISTQGIARDITERKRAEREREKLEAQLRQAQKMEAIGTLAGGIAHDFNNILSAIVGYTEIARLRVAENNKARDSLNKVLKASDRAKDLVSQILSFSRQGENERRPVQVSSIVKETLKLLRASLPATIKIRQNIDTQTGIVESNPTQIHQVIMNLCTNAHHAMREKGGELAVSLRNMDVISAEEHPNLKPGAYLRLTVSDTGHGIAPEILERIFDPYFTTKEKGEGTGLGLAVVHGIVKNHGGTIVVETKPGQGTTFHVYWPQVRDVKECEKSEEVALQPQGHESILFIDDEQTLVEIGKQMLTSLGYEVVTTTSSTAAIDLFREEPDRFDLVISDMTMPNMTGDALARDLMQIRPDIPIIICTGFSEHIDAERAATMGIKDFIMKPLTLNQLSKTIRKVLDQTD